MPTPIRRNAVKAGPALLCGLHGSSPNRGDPLTSNKQPANRKYNPRAFGSGFLNFRRTFLGSVNILISGISKDSAGAVLTSCIVDLFQVLDKTGPSVPPTLWKARTVSDSVTGEFSFSVPSNGWIYQIISYKEGAPDVAGISVNTLVGI